MGKIVIEENYLLFEWDMVSGRVRGLDNVRESGESG